MHCFLDYKISLLYPFHSHTHTRHLPMYRTCFLAKKFLFTFFLSEISFVAHVTKHGDKTTEKSFEIFVLSAIRLANFPIHLTTERRRKKN